MVFPAHAGMFLIAQNGHEVSASFPRARGDVPEAWKGMGLAQKFSPRTRGCSSPHECVPGPPQVFPAHAGMFRDEDQLKELVPGFPRARGDVPAHTEWVPLGHWFSPRTRGCSSSAICFLVVCGVFPAHAGMFLDFGAGALSLLRFPRARGDVPTIIPLFGMLTRFSPRTRGCSYGVVAGNGHGGVFPAHAGMFLIEGFFQPYPARFPRARGDVPVMVSDQPLLTSFSPRTRGCSFDAVIEHVFASCFPRARGDVPWETGKGWSETMFSPRTRGCSCFVVAELPSSLVFPAHAGMFRLFSVAGSLRRCFPRARGDVPTRLIGGEN